MNALYVLVDSRGGIASAMQGGVNLNKVDPDWERFVVMASDDPDELCREANAGTYGDDCVVATADGDVRWEWYQTGRWHT